ncbi:MAG: FGGY family carbohydrate kinase [Candidatus Bathyarchaeia archaeon]
MLTVTSYLMRETYEETIAVFDIGKSNKKFILFSKDLKPLYSDYTRIGEVKIGDLLCDDSESIISWIKSKLLYASRRWGLSALSITTFGATIANLKKGALRLPIISYNQEIDKRIKEKFYGEFGSPLELYLSTGTPPYGQLLNAGIQVYWIRENFPEIFNDIDEIMFLPQYLTYILAGFKSSEITSIGCHTYLYDMRGREWSNVAKGLMVDVRSPAMFNVWEPLGEFKVGNSNITVTPGIHDSNASLLPHIIRGNKILLASTGTWCVFMYPWGAFNPRNDDLYKDVLYYIDAFGNPVRSARFKGGFEYDHYASIIRNKFQINLKDIPFDINVLNDILRRKEDFIAPGLIEGSGQFQRSKAEIIGKAFYSSAKEAYHLLNLYLAIESYFAINLVTNSENADIFVQGGFAKNNIYLKILSALFPKSRVFKTIFTEATGLGAAICAKCALENIKPHNIDTDLLNVIIKEIPKPDIDEERLHEYVDAFISKFSVN